MAAELGLPLAQLGAFDLKLICEAPHRSRPLLPSDVKNALRFSGFPPGATAPEALRRYGWSRLAALGREREARTGDAGGMARHRRGVARTIRHVDGCSDLVLRQLVYLATGQVSLAPGQLIRVYPQLGRSSQPAVTSLAPGQLLLPAMASPADVTAALSLSLEAAARAR